MRVWHWLVLAAVSIPIAWTDPQAQARDPAPVLAAARAALGGEKNLGGVTSFVATGRTRQLRGNNLVPIEFEISCELPDRYVRRDEIPAQDTDIAVNGFVGDTLIQGAPAPGRGGPPPAGAARGAAPADGRGRGPAPNPAQQRLLALKQDFARLMLGVFAASTPAYPLTFAYSAVAEAPEGKADVLDVTAPPNFNARLLIAQQTHLPVMLMWRPPGAPAPGGAAPPESRLYFADYRDVNGIKWPFRIRRAVGPDTIEETTFDRVRINVTIDPRKFEAPK
jgi:hypothetical protein